MQRNEYEPMHEWENSVMNKLFAELTTKLDTNKIDMWRCFFFRWET